MRTTIGRRALCISLLLAACVLPAAFAQEIKVTLLGAGTPAPVMNRFGPSILVEAGGQQFFFDAGRGALLASDIAEGLCMRRTA
jgi:ribonuclease Z